MKFGLILGLSAFAAAAQAALTTISFEEITHGANLTNQYAALGISFTATDTAVAKRPGGGFNFTDYPPRTGDALIVSKFTGFITATFTHDVSYIEVYVRSPQTFGGKLTATSASGATLATATSPTSGSYQKLSVTASGIRGFTIQSPNGFSTVDDLSFTAAPVPEPATMVALGLGALGFLRRKKA